MFNFLQAVQVEVTVDKVSFYYNFGEIVYPTYSYACFWKSIGSAYYFRHMHTHYYYFQSPIKIQVFKSIFIQRYKKLRVAWSGLNLLPLVKTAQC